MEDSTNNCARKTIDMADACAQLGISLKSGYLAAARGEIDCIRIGRRVLVNKESFDRLMSARSKGSDISEGKGGIPCEKSTVLSG